MKGGAYLAPCAKCGLPLQFPLLETPWGAMHAACAPPSVQRAATIKQALHVVLAVGVLGAVSAVPYALDHLRREERRDADEVAEAAVSTPPVPHQRTFKYEVGAWEWETVVVAAGTPDAKLCELAQWLHARKSYARFTYFDDASRTGEFATWASRPGAPKPAALAAWARAHHRGVSTIGQGAYVFDGDNPDDPADPAFTCALK